MSVIVLRTDSNDNIHEIITNAKHLACSTEAGQSNGESSVHVRTVRDRELETWRHHQRR